MNNISIHDTKLDPIAQTSQETTIERSRNQQTSLCSGDKVFLYGDRTYKGTLIHPIERTSPPRWTVQLSRGGYEAVNIQHITVIESKKNQSLSEPIGDRDELDLEIPFSHTSETLAKLRPVTKIETKTTSELEEKILILENTISQLKAEQEASKQQYQELQQENEILKKDLECAKQVIRRAKDASPVMRFSLKRVLRLAHHACMDVQRTVGGWILRMGDKARKFRRLADIWDLISQDEFILSEIFPEEKLIDVNLIQPPRKRTKPEPLEKVTKPLMHPKDVIRNRTMYLVRSGLENISAIAPPTRSPERGETQYV